MPCTKVSGNWKSDPLSSFIKTSKPKKIFFLDAAVNVYFSSEVIIVRTFLSYLELTI